MGSGILQLASYGRQDMLFTKMPTITYFKKVYKRHTNYASESIPQLFNITPDFGQRVTCTISDIGDLLTSIYLNINLPPVGKFVDINNENGDGNSKIACCAWSNNIGYKIIRKIEMEINDKVIEKHTYDWFNIYNEVYNFMGHKEGLDKMIGNVPELTDLTCTKQGYQLSVPLIFWFNRHPNLAYPLIASYNSDVKINVEFNTLENCLVIGPTHYVTISEEICLFERGDIIYQNVNNLVHYFKFIYHDVSNKRLYYIKITTEEMLSTNSIYLSTNDSIYVTPILKEKLYFNKKKYFPQTINLALGETYLLVDYIFLDTKEKKMFVKNKLSYVINILQYDNPRVIYHAHTKIKINYTLPCTQLLFNCGYDYIHEGWLKEAFNYTNDIYGKDEIIDKLILYMNGQERFSEREMKHFNYLQPYTYHNHPPPIGVGTYSFATEVHNIQPSGYCNFSKMSDIELRLTINKNVSYNRPVKFKIYAMVLDIMEFENGICTLKF